MKVGIMSLQRIKNYGSFLQAYGLKKILESFGNEVVFVDYQFQDEFVTTPIIKKSIITKFKNNINIYKFIQKKMYINKFVKEYIPQLCGEKYNYLDKTIDSLVIGSDEVFNCLQSYPVGYSKELFGEHYEDKNVISYAASFGQTNIERLKKFRIDQEIASLLRKFKNISVRDLNSFNTIERLINKEPSINLDPVLVYDYKNDLVDNVIIKDYILLYTYPERLSNTEKNMIKTFAKKHKKKIVNIGVYCDIANINIIVHPLEVMSYFEHADFIITDTFHGSIFSIKTHSQFCAIVRTGNYGNINKLYDLLKRLKKEEVILNDITELEKMYNNNVNYAETDKIIEEERKKTFDYLKNNITDGN